MNLPFFKVSSYDQSHRILLKSFSDDHLNITRVILDQNKEKQNPVALAIKDDGLSYIDHFRTSFLNGDENNFEIIPIATEEETMIMIQYEKQMNPENISIIHRKVDARQQDPAFISAVTCSPKWFESTPLFKKHNNTKKIEPKASSTRSFLLYSEYDPYEGGCDIRYDEKRYGGSYVCTFNPPINSTIYEEIFLGDNMLRMRKKNLEEVEEHRQKEEFNKRELKRKNSDSFSS